MKLKFKLSKKDKELFQAYCNGGEEIDWKLLAHCIGAFYNWLVPNRKEDLTLRVSSAERNDDYKGSYGYGKTLGLNYSNLRNFKELIKILCHEFYHWHQHHVDNRSSYSMVNNYNTKRWSMIDCEWEATQWEKIVGKKVFMLYNNLREVKKVQEEIFKHKNGYFNRSKQTE